MSSIIFFFPSAAFNGAKCAHDEEGEGELAAVEDENLIHSWTSTSMHVQNRFKGRLKQDLEQKKIIMHSQRSSRILLLRKMWKKVWSKRWKVKYRSKGCGRDFLECWNSFTEIYWNAATKTCHVATVVPTSVNAVCLLLIYQINWTILQ